MIYRKQKKWIEFILRLMPFIALLLYVFGIILVYHRSGTLPDLFSQGLNEFFNSLFGSFVYDVFNLSEMTGFGNLFNNFYTWIEANISDNILILFSVLICSYQVFISLILLLFDFLTFIIEFARKWLDGLYGKERF